MLFGPLMTLPLMAAPAMVAPAVIGANEGVLLLVEIDAGAPVSNPSDPETTLYVSDGFWQGGPLDPDRPDQPYPSRIVAGSLRIERKMAVLPEDTARGEVSVSELTLLTGDGYVTPYAQPHSFRHRPVRAWLGPARLPRDEVAFERFEQVLNGIVSEGLRIDRMRTALDIGPLGLALEKPIQANTYGGTGGLDGGADLKGKRKPLWFGWRYSVPGYLLSYADQVYQFHHGSMAGFDEVRDQGQPLAAGSVIAWQGSAAATYAALAAAVVAEGGNRAAPSIGCVKVGSPIVGPLTATGRGDADTAFGGYVATHSDIAIHKILARSGVDYADIAIGSFSAWPAGECGYYVGLDEQKTIADALSDVARSCMGGWRADPDGRYVATRLVLPSSLAPAVEITEATAFAVQQLPPLQDARYFQPVAYASLDRVHGDGEVAGSIDDETRLRLTQPYRSYSTTPDADVLAAYAKPLAPDPHVSLFRSEADAVTLADYSMALHGVERRPYEVRTKGRWRTLSPGLGATLTWPDLGVSGFPVVITSHAYDAGADETSLLVWG